MFESKYFLKKSTIHIERKVFPNITSAKLHDLLKPAYVHNALTKLVDADFEPKGLYTCMSSK